MRGVRRVVLKRDENYISEIKKWLVAISSANFFVSLIMLKDLNDLWSFSMTYFMSISLTFYNFTSISKCAKIRRDRTIKLSFASIATIFISITLSKLSVELSAAILIVVKAFFIYYMGNACYCVFKDDSELVTNEMKEASKLTRDSLQRIKEEKIFSSRDFKTEQNYKTKKFVEDKE